MYLTEMGNEIAELLASNVAAMSDDELVAATLELETLRNQLDAAQMLNLALLQQRKTHSISGHHRSETTWFASATRCKRPVAGRRMRLALTLVHTMPEVWRAYANGSITAEHVHAIGALANRSELRDAAIRDQSHFIRWAAEQWPIFRQYLDAWAELMDPTDPADIDDKALDDRRLVWGEGVGKVTLAELNSPNICFDQIIKAITPTYDRLLESEWADLRASLGDAATPHDLPRTIPQRWHDAWVIVTRAGAKAIDPGADFAVNVVTDLDTLLAEAERRAAQAQGQPAPPRNVDATDAETYRCETIYGSSITPSMALLVGLAGHIRRITLDASSLDFEASAKARLFTGTKKLGLIIRDRHCTAHGCDIPAHLCQADHITPHTQDGPTVPLNGQMLCRACHRHKTRLEALGITPI